MMVTDPVCWQFRYLNNGFWSDWEMIKPAFGLTVDQIVEAIESNGNADTQIRPLYTRPIAPLSIDSIYQLGKDDGSFMLPVTFAESLQQELGIL